MQDNISNLQDWFTQRIRLMADPYFDREFFTNLIHCMDRKKSLREVFEATVEEAGRTGQFDESIDRAFVHLFYSYQAAHFLRESYQWLPLAGGIYGLALYRSDAREPLNLSEEKVIPSQASTIEEFQNLIRQEARRVSSYEKAWASFQFLLENRTTRSKVLSVLIQALIYEGDLLSVCLLTRAIDASFATGWKSQSNLMHRAFQRFWEEGKDFEISSSFQKALSLEKSRPLSLTKGASPAWKNEWAEELWHRVSEQSLESAWEFIHQLGSEGVGFEQVICSLDLMRGRCLFGMKYDQWPMITKSLLYGDALRSCIRWAPDKAGVLIGASLAELVETAQKVSKENLLFKPMDLMPMGLSKNISKNQLVLRLDDSIEKGDQASSLTLLSVLVEDHGLAHSVADRLVLVAAKQDVWTYDFSTIPTSMILTQAYQEAIRLNIRVKLTGDALLGLCRYLCEQRREALQMVQKRGNYGDGGLYESPFDVSGGARIVERFVFNQMRNAQRIFTWPSEGKG